MTFARPFLLLLLICFQTVTSAREDSPDVAAARKARDHGALDDLRAAIAKAQKEANEKNTFDTYLRLALFHEYLIEALQAMGADVEVQPEGIVARADRLHGAKLTLPYPSVGATETVLLTAVLAEGRTVLRNAAVEPEVTELALFLQRMGARIGFSPDRRIVVEGVERLHRATARLQGDRLDCTEHFADQRTQLHRQLDPG